MHDLYDLRDADASCGGKALGLARLLAADLPVPDGFAISARAFERFAAGTPGEMILVVEARDAAMAALDAEIVARARALGDRVAVRSSAAIEDGVGGSAAGLFLSEVPVPAGDVTAAVRAVWRSALAPHAIAYAKTHEIPIGVIVQRYVEGPNATVYTRALDRDRTDATTRDDDVLVQRGGELTRLRRTADDPAVVLALRAEAALGVPADVELAGDWIVQARPIVAPRPRAHVASPPPIVLAALQDGRVWTWDVTHNPDPLSVAQTELVERVEAARLGDHELRVCAGYLYATRREPRTRSFEHESPTALVAQCRALELEAEQVLSRATTSLDEALAIYLEFYRLWADELSPRISLLRRSDPEAEHRHGAKNLSRRNEGTRADAMDRERRHAGGHPKPSATSAAIAPGLGSELDDDRGSSSRPSSVEATLAAGARGAIDFAEVVRRIGALAPTWDIATPTFGERPDLLRRAIELADSGPGSGPESGSGSESEPASASLARIDPARSSLIRPITSEDIDARSIVADLAERDDLLFARAQWIVRQALLALGQQRAIGDDVFWIRFDDLENASLEPEALRRKAAGARAAAERAGKWQMPLTVGADPVEHEGAALRGIGHGPAVVGRVVRFESLARAVLASAGDVVVVRAVTPALAVFVGKCAALVSETGGLLDHGAALARELGITCVVGCRDAWTTLVEGEVVRVDGDGGTVTRA